MPPGWTVRADADGGVQCAAEGSEGVGERCEGDRRRVGGGCVLRDPYASASGADIEAITGGVRGVKGERGNPAGDEAECRGLDGCGAEGLPGGRDAGVGSIRFWMDDRRPGARDAGRRAVAGGPSALGEEALGFEDARGEGARLRCGLLRGGERDRCAKGQCYEGDGAFEGGGLGYASGGDTLGEPAVGGRGVGLKYEDEILHTRPESGSGFTSPQSSEGA